MLASTGGQVGLLLALWALLAGAGLLLFKGPELLAAGRTGWSRRH